MGSLTAVSPVPPSLALEFAGPVALLRKVALHQSRGDAIAILADGRPVCLAMFEKKGARRAEIACLFGPAAPKNMARLIRFAQLTLTRMSDAGVLVFTRAATRQGERIARATGLRPGRFADPTIWIWKGK